MSTPVPIVQSSDRALKIGLWVAQGLVALVFCAAGLFKFLTPIAQLSTSMAWTGQAPEPFVRLIGLIDLAGGLGLVLPAVTRIKPGLTVLAALGCTALQVCAIIFHVSRGEAMLTPLNLILLILSAFIYWGRRFKAPIAPRG